VQKDFAPVINIAGVIALAQMAAVFAIINTAIYLWYGKEVVVPYHGLLPGVVGLILYFFNEKYFRKREHEILMKFGAKEKRFKWLILIGSFLSIALVLWLWMEDGLYRMICYLQGRDPNLF
jgi:hypothetical protein